MPRVLIGALDPVLCIFRHMSDSQSFPLEVKTRPKLWDAAYSPQQRYSQADVAAIVEYARLRGVRTMVEFDVGQLVHLIRASSLDHPWPTNR